MLLPSVKCLVFAGTKYKTYSAPAEKHYFLINGEIDNSS